MKNKHPRSTNIPTNDRQHCNTPEPPPSPNSQGRGGAGRVGYLYCVWQVFSFKSPTLIDMDGGKNEKQEFKGVHRAVMNKLGGRKGTQCEDGSYANRRYPHGNPGKDSVHSCVY